MSNLNSPLIRAAGTSLHRQLYVVLRDRILQNFWPAGTPLPTEEALCAQFQVSRITVRRALADLANHGLVERRHGLGTFALPHAVPSRPEATLSLLDELHNAAAGSKVQVIEVRKDPAPSNVARLLQINPGEQAHHSLRLRQIGDTPVMLADAWIPDPLGKRITMTALKKHALYEAIMMQGVRFGRMVQEISCEAADPRRAQLLGTEVGMPLIKLIRLMHDAESRPILYLIATMSPERSRILMDIPGENINSLSAGQIAHDGVEQRSRGGRPLLA